LCAIDRVIQRIAESETVIGNLKAATILFPTFATAVAGDLYAPNKFSYM
jgi:hypothetical protein